MKLSILCFVFLLFLLSSNIASVRSASWSEVARFSDLGNYTSDYFNISHIEWRIDWNYTPSSDNPTTASLGVIVYRQEGNTMITSILKSGNTTTGGVENTLSLPGTFYLKIGIADLEHYTVVIEQDMSSSVPELPSMVLPLLFATGIVAVMILTIRRFQSLRQR